MNEIYYDGVSTFFFRGLQLFDNVACNVAFAFLDIYTVAVWSLLTDPTGDVFSRRVEGEEFIEISVVEIGGDALLDVAEINHHSVGVKLFGPAMDSHDPVMAVETGAFAFVGKVEAVATRKFESFGDIIHLDGIITLRWMLRQRDADRARLRLSA